MHPLFPKIVSAVPLKTFRLNIAEHGQSQLVQALKQFADANHFVSHIAQTEPDPRRIVIGMKRDDIGVTITNPFTPDDVHISFNKLAPGAPAVPQNILDQLTASLKSFLPGLTDDPPRSP